MDRDYIKLCAEMAYNEVIFEATLSEEYDMLNEGVIENLFEKFKSVISKIKTFITQTMNKIINFILSKVKELKAKIAEIKKKKEEKSQEQKEKEASEKFSKKLKERDSKQESAPMYDQLMEMLLVEEAGINYDHVLSKIHSEIIRSLIDKFNTTVSIQQEFSNKLLNILNKSVNVKDIDYVLKDMNRTSQNFQEQSNLTVWCSDIEKQIEKFKENNFDIDKNSYPSEGFLNTCADICDDYKRSCEMQLKFIDIDLKQHEETYREVSKDKELSNDQKDILIGYHRNSISILNKGTENFNKISGFFVQAMKLILTLPAKTYTD